jgi:large subunit ribosomal protein L1
MDFAKAIAQLRENSKKRNFVQTLELIVNFSGIDFSKPENRIDLEISLPSGRGKGVKIAAIVGDELIVEAKRVADRVITKAEVESFGKDKKSLKALASDFEYFVCQTDLMALVGKNMGQVLAPRGKMPKPIPPTAKLEPVLERMKKSIRVKTKGKFLPTVQAIVGTEEMADADIIKNAETVYSAVREKLPNKEGNIRSIFLKTSMGPAIRVEK